MSVEGPLIAIHRPPVLSVHQNSSPPTSTKYIASSHSLLSPNPNSSSSPTEHMMSGSNSNSAQSWLSAPFQGRRERVYSEGQVFIPSSPQPRRPPQTLLTQNSLLSTSYTPSLTQRSLSMPREPRAISAEPDNAIQGETLHESLRMMSPRLSRRMKRSPTIDTDSITKEEYDDYMRVNQYKVLDIIGHGSYGIVRKATDDKDETYAMKILGKRKLIKKNGLRGRPRPGMKQNKPKDPLEKIRREIAILKKLDHPNIVRLYEVLDDSREDELILVFEYIPRGCVIKKIPMEKPFSEDKSREYFIDLILGIEYLHSQHVIHRDIKPENLLLDDEDNLKIADFGVSEEIDQTESHLTKWAGTPAFVAPETLTAENSFKGQAVDIWAAGITLYCFVFGKVPFSPPSIPELYKMIQNEEIPMPTDMELSPELRDLLSKLLQKDPAKRITIPEIRQHPWVLKTDNPLPSKEVNCGNEICISEEDIQGALKPFYTPLHILVMIKQMAKKKSLVHPFSPRSSPRVSPKVSPRNSPTNSPSDPSSPITSPSHVYQSVFKPSTADSEEQTDNVSSKKREKFARSHQTPSILINNVEDGSLSQSSP